MNVCDRCSTRMTTLYKSSRKATVPSVVHQLMIPLKPVTEFDTSLPSSLNHNVQNCDTESKIYVKILDPVNNLLSDDGIDGVCNLYFIYIYEYLYVQLCTAVYTVGNYGFIPKNKTKFCCRHYKNSILYL